MKIRTTDILFALTATSFFLAVFFIRHSGEFGQPYFQVKLTAEKAGVTQLFLNYGSGYSENLSKRLVVDASKGPKTIRLPLGNFAVDSIRFDPLNAGGTISINNMAITTGNGTVIQQLTTDNITQTINLHDLQVGSDKSIHFKVDLHSDDPQIYLAGIPPHVFSTQTGKYYDQSFGWGFAVFVLSLLAASLLRTPRVAPLCSMLAKQLYLINRKAC